MRAADEYSAVFTRFSLTSTRAGLLPMLLLALFAAAAAGQVKDANRWQYRAGEASSAFRQPVFRGLMLSRDAPEDLVDRVPANGAKRSYAQWHYGTQDSTRVTLLVDQLSGGAYELYVDLNRDRVIDANEKIEGSGRTRQWEMPVELVESFAKTHAPRQLVARLATTGTSISVATSGFVEGRVHIDGREGAARSVDGDANGFFSDPRDRLWLDLNANGEWDPIAEQFPFLPILRIAERRYAVRADRLGTRLALEAVEGEGRVRLQIAGLAPTSRVTRLDVMLFGEDSSAYSVTGFEPAELPVGRYTLGSVSIAILDGKATRPWVFVFSRGGDLDSRQWHRVSEDNELVLDPIGSLRFEPNVTDRVKGRRPGQTITMAPRLYTSDDLLINSCSFGEVDLYSSASQYNSAVLKLQAPDGALLSQVQSGFS